MDIKVIQEKKRNIEERVKVLIENKQKAIKIVQELSNEILKLTGAYEQLLELEKEFDKTHN